jgi:hypothetical protein
MIGQQRPVIGKVWGDGRHVCVSLRVLLLDALGRSVTMIGGCGDGSFAYSWTILLREFDRSLEDVRIY